MSTNGHVIVLHEMRCAHCREAVADLPDNWAENDCPLRELESPPVPREPAELLFNEYAMDVCRDMMLACHRVAAAYGPASDEYLKMVGSLTQAMSNMFRLGGRVTKDGELSLYVVARSIHYGVVFFPDVRPADRSDLTRLACPGTWSVHS